MDPWVLWVIAAVVLAIGEMATLSFFLANCTEDENGHVGNPAGQIVQ